jgi:TatD DNase family protein
MLFSANGLEDFAVPTIIDSHAHVVREYFPEDQAEVIARAFASGVVQMVNPGVVIDNVQELLDLSERYEHIYTAIGLHPHEAKHWNAAAETEMRKAAEHPKVVGIGECGLDFYYNNSKREDQLNAFRAQIRIAKELNKPIIIHCRDAWDEALTELERERSEQLRGVFHCFTGGPEVLPRIASLDFYVSFSGIVTFKKAEKIQEAARLAALDRILVETDSPFLAPQKMRGQRNEPAFVWHVAEKIAELRRQELEQICTACCRNTRRLFNLPDISGAA